MKKLSIMLALLLVAGCASLDTYNEYSNSTVSNVKYKGTTYKIREHPTDQTLLVEGSLGQAVQIGLTLGSKVVPNSHIKQAATKYLQSSNSECIVSDVDEIMDNLFVAILSC